MPLVLLTPPAVPHGSVRVTVLDGGQGLAVVAATAHHIASSLKYLPTIARQLYHSRDLGEPFDFLTWFEYAPADANAFEELVGTLRATEEWRHVEREVDIRMERERLDAG